MAWTSEPTSGRLVPRGISLTLSGKAPLIFKDNMIKNMQSG